MVLDQLGIHVDKLSDIHQHIKRQSGKIFIGWGWILELYLVNVLVCKAFPGTFMNAETYMIQMLLNYTFFKVITAMLSHLIRKVKIGKTKLIFPPHVIWL